MVEQHDSDINVSLPPDDKETGGSSGYGWRQNTTCFLGGRDFWRRSLPLSPQALAWPWRSQWRGCWSLRGVLRQP